MKFSRKSLEKLKTCDPRLQEICQEAIKYIDFAVIEGHRGEEAQEKAYREKKSKARWGQSLHNKTPSLAVDLFPSPYNWNNIDSFCVLGDVVLGIAKRKGIRLNWGGDWPNFKDYVHFELADD